MRDSAPPVSPSSIGEAGTDEATNAATVTVTLLFTDIEGSTQRWEQTPDMSDIVERHFAVLRQEVANAGGIVFSEMGDGVAAAFDSTGTALSAALGAQLRLAELGLGVRMGIHTGDVERSGDDFRGRAVNRAARIMALARGGQVLISDVTTSLLRAGTSPRLFDLADVGVHELRGWRIPNGSGSSSIPASRCGCPSRHRAARLRRRGRSRPIARRSWDATAIVDSSPTAYGRNGS